MPLLPTNDYRKELLSSYEDEVSGAAYFEALVAHYPSKAASLSRCVALESETAAMLLPLLQRYQLTAQAIELLVAQGQRDAALDGAKGWPQLMQEAMVLYPLYLAQFKELETLAPVEDLPVMQALTAHEARLIEWLGAER